MKFSFGLDNNIRFGFKNIVPQSGNAQQLPAGIASISASGTTGAAGEAVEQQPSELWDFVQENNDDSKRSASLTVRIKGDQNSCLLLACAMHRGKIPEAPEGFEKAAETVSAVSTNQYITIWKKVVTGGEKCIVTVTQDSSARMSLKAIVLYNAADVTVVENLLLEKVPHTPPPISGKRRLYFWDSVYASNDGVSNSCQISGSEGLDLKEAAEQRFSVYYDYQPELGILPSFGYYSPTDWHENTAHFIALDIEEV